MHEGTTTTRARRRRRRSRGGGFTLIEVLIAMLIASVGLLGTLGIQYTLLRSMHNADSAAVAMRLASQSLEELTAVPTERFRTLASGTWSPEVYLDEYGRRSAIRTAQARFVRTTRITDVGVGLPYNISVMVRYDLDDGSDKVVRFDLERRKPW